MKKFKLFGVALDPSDNPRSLMIKHGYMEKASKGALKTPNFLDPYEAVKALIQLENAEPLGKIPVESWLTPKPIPEDAMLVNPLDYQIFLDSNGCMEYFEKTEQFVKEKILPDIPLLVAPDHSPTGGVLKALSDFYGADQITVVIFDSHFDAIPSKVRLQLGQYAQEHQLHAVHPEQAEFFSDTKRDIPLSYNCGTFLSYLLEEKIILTSNLIVVGVSDYPSEELRAINDERVKNFVKTYFNFQDKGVKFIPKLASEQDIVDQFDRFLTEVTTPYLYVSFDVDVSSFEAVFATRFLDVIGLKPQTIIKLAQVIHRHLSNGMFQLIGLDLTEIEVHLLQAKLKSGREDKTVDLIQEFLNSVLEGK